MADYTDDGLFREIEDELKQDRALKFWYSYRIYIIAAVVIPILTVGGYQGWNVWKLQKLAGYSEKFFSAKTLESEKPNEAYAIFSKLSQESTVGYKVLSKFQVAAHYIEAKNFTAAIDAYNKLSDDTAIDAIYRDLAKLLTAVLSIESNTMSNKEVIDKLSSLTEGKSPWRFSALELTAFLMKKNGDIEKAKKIYQKLIVDPQTSSGIRQRSQAIMLNFPKD